MIKLILQPNTILVLIGKHGDRFFHVPTTDILKKVAFKIVKERIKDGYWYDFSELDKVVTPDISLETAKNFKDLALKAQVKTAWDRYHSKLGHINYLVKQKKLLDEIIKNKDMDAAWELLRLRRDGQYEGYYLTTLENPE